MTIKAITRRLRHTRPGLHFYIALAVFCAVVPTAILMLLTLEANRTATLDRAASDALGMAQRVQERHHSAVEHVMSVMQAIKRARPIVEADQDQCSLYLAKVAEEQRSLISRLWISDGISGRTLCASNSDTGLSASERAHFSRVMRNGSPMMSEALIRRAEHGKAPMIIAAHSIKRHVPSADLLFASVSLDWMRDVESDIRQHSGGLVLLLDRDGAILNRPAPGDIVDDADGSGLENMVHALINHRRGEVATVPDAYGIPHLFVTESLADAGSIVAVGLPVDRIMAPVNSHTRVQLATLAVISVLSMVLAWFIAEIFVLRWVRRLTIATKRMARGDFNMRIEVPSYAGELHHLARSFNAMADEIGHAAYYDRLTGLPNRRLFERELQVIERCDSQAVAVIAIDLDGFKPINDENGHGTGDQVLAAVGGRLENAMRGLGIVARLGGDEFVALATCAPQDARLRGQMVARILREAISAPIIVDGRAHRLTCSTGIAVWPEGSNSLSDAVLRADDAMYAAKRTGNNCIVEAWPLVNVSGAEKPVLPSAARVA